MENRIMSNKQKNKKEYCRHCGAEMLQFEEPAEGKEKPVGFPMVYARLIMTRFNREGKLQYVDVFRCPNWKQRWFGGSKHDAFYKLRKNFDYESEVKVF